MEVVKPYALPHAVRHPQIHFTRPAGSWISIHAAILAEPKDKGALKGPHSLGLRLSNNFADDSLWIFTFGQPHFTSYLDLECVEDSYLLAGLGLEVETMFRTSSADPLVAVLDVQGFMAALTQSLEKFVQVHEKFFYDWQGDVALVQRDAKFFGFYWRLPDGEGPRP